MRKPVTKTEKRLETKELWDILPHRYPFLLVDRIIDWDVEKGYIVGQKNVTINEFYFQGHFPDAPIMPGVLILEALAQTAGVLIHLKGELERIAVLLTVNNAKFRNPVKPGDTLTLKGENLQLGSRSGKVQATAMVGDKIAAEAEIAFCLVKKEQI